MSSSRIDEHQWKERSNKYISGLKVVSRYLRNSHKPLISITTLLKETQIFTSYQSQFIPSNSSSTTNHKMSLRSPTALLQLFTLASLGSMTLYFKSHHDYNLQEHEARMDELEGTLRGHIGLIEESLERIEGRKSGGKGEKA